jgi:hypothetical protein
MCACVLSHPALGWLKVGYDVDKLDCQNWICTFLLFPYMAIDWQLVTSVW